MSPGVIERRDAARTGSGELGVTEAELRREFLAHVAQVPGGRRLLRCLQCGTCAGSCPVSYAMDLSPRALVARFRAGDVRAILESRSIWLCASCYACTTRCPAGIKVTDILYALKRMAVEQGLRPSSFPPLAMAESFVTMVRRYGRNNEPRLLALYFVRTRFREMIDKIPMALALLRRGRLGLRAKRIRGLADLNRIIARAEHLEMRYADEIAARPTADVGYGTLAMEPPHATPAAPAAA